MHQTVRIRRARRHLIRATTAESRLHAAVVLEALGQLDPTLAELAEAVELDPDLDQTPEAKALRQRFESQADGR